MSEKEKQNTHEGVFVASGGFQEKKKISWTKSILLAVLIMLGGGFFVFNTFAASNYDAQVTQAFNYALCGQSPAASDVAYWSQRLANGSWTYDQLVGQLRNTQTGRTCTDPGESSSSTGSGSSGTTNPNTVTTHTVNATDAEAAQVRSAYQDELCRDASYADINYWAAKIKADRLSDARFRQILDATTEGQRCNAQRARATNGTCPDPSKVADPANRPGYTYHDLNEEIVRDAYNRYTTISIGWDQFTGAPAEWVSKLDRCLTTKGELIKALLATPEGQARTQLEKDKAEYTKRIQIAYAAALREALAAQGGHFNRVNPLMRWDLCEAVAADANQYIIPGFCFNGVGLPFPAVDALVTQVLRNQISIAEAENIARNISTNPDPCAYAIGHGDSTVCMGSQGTGNLTPANSTGSPSGNPQTGERTAPNGTNYNVNNGGGFTSGGKSGDDYVAVDNPTTQAVQRVLEDVQPVTTTSSVSACTNNSSDATCVTVPVGQNTVAATTAVTPDIVTSASDASNIDSCQGVLCDNENTQEWSYDDRDRSSDPASTSARQAVPTQQVARCVDRYETLLPGDNSACVLVARVYLWLSDYLPSLSDSSAFDQTMKDAVIKFQKDNNISPSDGTISKSTWDALKIAAGRAHEARRTVANDQRTVTETSTIASANSAAIILPKCPRKPLLKLGATGDCVKRVQQMLVLVQESDLKISGTFDDATEAALKIFQASHNLKPTGTTDKQTWVILELAAVPVIHKSPFQSGRGALINMRPQNLGIAAN